MIATINLLWIIPLSAMAGGFVLVVLLVYSFLNNARRNQNGRAAGTQNDQAKQEVADKAAGKGPEGPGAGR